VQIVSGFVTPARCSGHPRIEWVHAPRGPAGTLARAAVAVVGGGVSLYEACAVRVTAVALPVVRGQVPTATAFGRRRAAMVLPFRATAQQTAKAVVGLLEQPERRKAIAARGARLIDGRGAARVARAVVDIVDGRAA
jgi:spore coat polysaccharide biosynthesis predicted glycosyltransferase SpsG